MLETSSYSVSFYSLQERYYKTLSLYHILRSAVTCGLDRASPRQFRGREHQRGWLHLPPSS